MGECSRSGYGPSPDNDLSMGWIYIMGRSGSSTRAKQLAVMEKRARELGGDETAVDMNDLVMYSQITAKHNGS